MNSISDTNTIVENKSPGSSPQKYTLLFVDDEPSILKALKRVFADDNYNILIAENAATAQGLLASNHIDLVVSDYNMPGINGVDLLRSIREKYPRIIRMMLSGHSETSVVMGAVNEGAVYKFMNKPWNEDELRLSIKLALAQYELIQENLKLKNVAQKQQSEIGKLKKFSGIECTTLGQILVSKGMLSIGQLEMAEEFRSQCNSVLVKALIQMEMIKESDLIKLIQDESKTDFVYLDGVVLDKGLGKLGNVNICV